MDNVVGIFSTQANAETYANDDGSYHATVFTTSEFQELHSSYPVLCHFHALQASGRCPTWKVLRYHVAHCDGCCLYREDVIDLQQLSVSC